MYKVFFKHIPLNPVIKHYEDIWTFLSSAIELGSIKKPEGRKDIFAASHVTIAVAEDSNRKELGRAFSFCSYNDSFSRRTGRMISSNRLLSDLQKSLDNSELRIVKIPILHKNSQKGCRWEIQSVKLQKEDQEITS